MQQKKRRKLRASDFFITLFCLCICGASLWFFWKDLNSSSTRTDIDKIATIHFKKNISQRKFNDRVVWERLQQDSELYNNDTIRTSDDAEAVIHFNDGTKIDLGENTMIQIVVENDGTVNLAVGGGDIEVDTTATKGTGVKLAMNDGSTVALDKGSRVTATSGETGAASSVSVRDGNAVVSTAKGESHSLETGEAVSIEDNGSVTKQNITVTSIPKYLTVYKMNGVLEPVKLIWKASEGSIIAEAASDSAFENTIARKTTAASASANNSYLDLLPQSEKVWWRVYSPEDSSSMVQGEIKVVELNKTNLTAPLNNSVFSYRKDPPSMRFTWQDDVNAEYYRLEVSNTEDFAAPFISEDIKTDSYSTDSLKKGNYFWRVTPYYRVNDIGFGTASETYSFYIEEKEGLTRPSLTLPADDAKILLSESDQNIIFSWKSDLANADYSIQLSDSPDFSVKFKTINTSSTIAGSKFNINSMPEGTYYWKVLRKSDEDRSTKNESAESEIRSFTIAKYIPGVNKLSWPPDGYSVEKDQLARLNFSWKLASEYKAENLPSVLQFAQSADFTNVVEEKTLTESQFAGAALQKGDYYWRIGVQKDGNSFAFSDPYRISVLTPMTAPVIIQPQKDEKLILANTAPVPFEWQPVSGADYYKLVITDEKGSVVKSEKTSNTWAKLDLPSSPDFTQYKVSLQGVTKETEAASMRTGAVSELSFALRRPVAVKLVAPVKEQSFDGLTALRTPIQFTWEAGDTPVSSKLTLQKQTANGNWRTVRTFDNPKKTINLSRLGEGRYKWYVAASGENGIVLDSAAETFVIKPVPALPVAVLQEPARNFKMDSAYLKNHRNLSFKWSKVNGASDYDFAIYQVLKNGTFKKVYSQKGLRQNEARIKDLSVFDLGTFEWRVTAYCHAKDGFEEQKSEIASSRFTIDFRLPDKVNTKTPDKMYGE